MQVNLSLLRHYLRTAQPVDGLDVLRDAALARDPGALELVSLNLELRANRRSRRSLQEVAFEVRGSARKPKWVERLAANTLALFRCMRKQCVPMAVHRVRC